MPKSKKTAVRMQLNILHMPNFLPFPNERVAISTEDPRLIDKLNKIIELDTPEVGIIPSVPGRFGFKDRIGILCVADKDKVEKLKRIFIKRIRNLFLRSEFFGWCLRKPYGYTGDFKIIDDIYQNNPTSSGFVRLTILNNGSIFL